MTEKWWEVSFENRPSISARAENPEKAQKTAEDFYREAFGQEDLVWKGTYLLDKPGGKRILDLLGGADEVE